MGLSYVDLFQREYSNSFIEPIIQGSPTSWERRHPEDRRFCDKLRCGTEVIFTALAVAKFLSYTYMCVVICYTIKTTELPD